MKIPKNLPVGTKLWYSETEFATASDDWGTPADGHVNARTDEGAIRVYRRKDGTEIDGDTPPIIRIERIASGKSKRAKVDKDAAWLLGKLASNYDAELKQMLILETGVTVRAWNCRIRAIARRLNGAKS